MTKFNEQVIKMSHISVIQMLEEKIDKNKPASFNKLNKMSIEELADLRDFLVIKYNRIIEARRFGAEMIYDRRKMAETIYFVNKEDWQEKFWKNNYHVWVTAQGIEFCVNADNEGEAMDFIMDYVVAMEMKGLYSTEPLGEEYETAGNNGYQFTTHNIRIEKLDV